MTVSGMSLSRRRMLFGTAGLIGGAALLGEPPPARAAAAPAFKTVVPGTFTIAMNGDMPMTSVKDGQLIGTDGEMIAMIAARLGLKVQPALMEWSATIESIRAGRADVMLGNMGWTSARAQVMLLTDQIYYAGKYMVMKKGMPFDSAVGIADVKGHSIGTVTGFTIVPEMKKIPGTTEVKLYDTTDACIRDVSAGRLDFAMLDAPTVGYLIQQNPGWGLKQIPVKPEADFPVLTRKQLSVMGMNLDNPDLFDAVNAGVKWLWRSGLNSKVMAKYGVDNPDYLIAPPVNPRLGVDRDAQGGLLGPGAHTSKDFSPFYA